MAKVLKDAALVVGVVAIGVATAGVGAFGAAAAASVSAAPTAAGAGPAAGLASAVTLGATARSVASMLAQKKPSPQVNPMQWQSDPEAGLPIIAGRTATLANVIDITFYRRKGAYSTPTSRFKLSIPRARA